MTALVIPPPPPHEPNLPPLTGLRRDQQRDIARREALAYYGTSLSTARRTGCARRASPRPTHDATVTSGPREVA